MGFWILYQNVCFLNFRYWLLFCFFRLQILLKILILVWVLLFLILTKSLGLNKYRVERCIDIYFRFFCRIPITSKVIIFLFFFNFGDWIWFRFEFFGWIALPSPDLDHRNHNHKEKQFLRRTSEWERLKVLRKKNQFLILIFKICIFLPFFFFLLMLLFSSFFPLML